LWGGTLQSGVKAGKRVGAGDGQEGRRAGGGQEGRIGKGSRLGGQKGRRRAEGQEGRRSEGREGRASEEMVCSFFFVLLNMQLVV
jgi:hypothetical protein